MRRTTWLAFGAALLLLSCSKEHPSTRGKGPAISRMIPADTPYAFVAMEPAPAAYYDRVLRAAGPSIDQMAAQMHEMGGQGTPLMRLLAAILDEWKGNFSPEGLEKLGFLTRPHFALYGLGLFPAWRLEIKDPAAVAAMVQRTLQKSGLPIEQAKLGSQPYWVWSDGKLSVVVAVEGQELVGMLCPKAVQAELVPRLLGEPPAQSINDIDTLGKIREQYKVPGYAVLFVDFTRIAQGLLDDGTLTRRELAALGATLPAISPVCKDEINALVGGVSRLAGGADFPSDHLVAMTMAFETKREWARALAALRAPVPGLGATPPGTLFSLGFGVDFEKSIALVKNIAMAIQARPFQCSFLADLNHEAAHMAKDLEQPAPQWLRGLKGANLVVKDFQAAFPPDAHGYVILSSDDPSKLLELAREQFPGLAGLALKPDGKPVAVPSGAIPFVNDLAIAMRGKALGVSVGKGADAEMSLVLASPPVENPPVVGFSYDMARIMKIIAQSGGKPPQAGVMDMYGLISSTVSIDDRGVIWKMTTELK